jgi:hypothetical protein
MKKLLGLVALLCVVFVSAPAQAIHHHRVAHQHHYHARAHKNLHPNYMTTSWGNPFGSFETNMRSIGPAISKPIHRGFTQFAERVSHPGYAWCGWWMQQHTGITSKSTGHNLNMAIEWRHVGSAASGPCVGCIMVEPHHVSKITQVLGNGTVMAISGNDGHQVRERIRTTHRAVAFRSL